MKSHSGDTTISSPAKLAQKGRKSTRSRVFARRRSKTAQKTPFYSVLYVSRSNLSPDMDPESQIEAMVAAAAEKNRVAGITGALIFTGRDFAQLIEGDRAAVEALMLSICRDPRHTDIVVLKNNEEGSRRFADWSLAYGGNSPLVSAILDRARLANTVSYAQSITGILRFMERFAVRNRQLDPQDSPSQRPRRSSTA